jgi:hypothetical protein
MKTSLLDNIVRYIIILGIAVAALIWIIISMGATGNDLLNMLVTVVIAAVAIYGVYKYDEIYKDDLQKH